MSWRGPAVLLWLGALLAPAQGPNSYLYPIREGNKFGFIDRTGSVVVAPKYAAVGEIQEGRIRVTEGQVSGYIDLSGKIVIDPRYDSAGELRGSRAVVRPSGFRGLQRATEGMEPVANAVRKSSGLKR
jgi:hypothetical protein